ncbi:hypothetical protein AGMMS50256_32330 [Betaproteobacteria bacterium]|nr:hypothetical protein AGMMS50256_32330 [Betaproteobacteria bacterium]
MNAIEMKDDTSRGVWQSIFLPPPHPPLPGHPLPQGERESKRLFMLYHDKYTHAIALKLPAG